MRRTAFSCVVLFCFQSPAISAVSQQQQQLFEAYPAGETRTGAAASLQLTSPFAQSYRGLLTLALRRPANFAGRYRLESWEAYNGCFRGAAVDLKTGAVAFLPLDMCGRGRPFASRSVIFRRGSTLVAIVDPTAGKRPVTRYFALSGADFTEVTKSVAQHAGMAGKAPEPSEAQLKAEPETKPQPKPQSEPKPQPTAQAQPHPAPAQVAVEAPEAEPAADAMEPPKGVDPVYPEAAQAPAPPPAGPREPEKRQASSPPAQQDAADIEATAPPKGASPVYPDPPAKLAESAAPAPDHAPPAETKTREAGPPAAQQDAADIEATAPPKGADPVYPDPPAKLAESPAPESSPAPPADPETREAGPPPAPQDSADLEATAPPKGADPVYPGKQAEPEETRAKPVTPPPVPSPDAASDKTGSLEVPNQKVSALASGDLEQAPAGEAAASAQSLAFSACGSTWGYFIDATNKANVSLVLEGLDKGPTLVLHIKDGATMSELVGVRDRGPWNLDLTVPPFGQEAVSRIIASGRLIFVSLSFVQSGTNNKLVLKTFGFNDTGKPCPPAPKPAVENQGVR